MGESIGDNMRYMPVSYQVRHFLALPVRDHQPCLP